MRDYLQGKRCMVWSFMGNTRMYQALRDYGDRLDTVGIFTFEVDATGTISETGTSISTMLTYINKWPHSPSSTNSSGGTTMPHLFSLAQSPQPSQVPHAFAS